MNDREKVIKGLELCRYDPDPGQPSKYEVSCDICPYWSNDFGCRMGELLKDAIAMLKAHEPTKMEIKHAISNVDIPKGVDEEQFFAVLGQQYAALAKLYGEDVPTYSPS